MRTRRRSARRTGVLLLTPLLALAVPLPATAAPVAPPAAPATRSVAAASTGLAAPTIAEDAPPASSRPADSTSLAADPAAATAATAPTAAAGGLEPAGGLETTKATRPVAPGVQLTSFDRYDADGWLRADALTTDLTGGATVDYVNSGAVSRAEPLRKAVDDSRAVAAVNGDFFDINNSGAAQGVGVRDGELIQSAVSGHRNAVAVTTSGLGRVIEVNFDGSATLPSGAVPLTQFNNLVQAGGIGAFTELWGRTPGSVPWRAPPAWSKSP